MGIFDDIGNWFENIFKQDVDEKKEKELITQLAGMEVDERNRIDKIINDIAESYKPANKEFEYLEAYTPKEEDVLLEESKNKYLGDFEKEQDKLFEKTQESLDKLDKKEEGYFDDAKQKQDEVLQDFVSDNEFFKNKTVLNGIADSSVQTSKKQELSAEKQQKDKEIEKELNDKLQQILQSKNAINENSELQKGELQKQFDKSVKEYFDKLMNDENAKVKEVVDKNKQTAKDEKAYKDYQNKVVENKRKELKEKKDEFFQNELIVGPENERKKEFDKRYNLAKQFYKQYEKKSATDAIAKNDSLKKFLGPYYIKLLSEISDGK